MNCAFEPFHTCVFFVKNSLQIGFSNIAFGTMLKADFVAHLKYVFSRVLRFRDEDEEVMLGRVIVSR